MKKRNRKMQTAVALGCMAGALFSGTKPESFFASEALAGNVVCAAETELDSESENSAGTEKLVYAVKDQLLESGKRLEDLETPEYAIDADGSPVYGRLVWMEPESGCILDGKMEICGAAGDEIRLGWIFLPNASFPDYETVNGVAVIRLKPAEKGEHTMNGVLFPCFPDHSKDSKESREKTSEQEEKEEREVSLVSKTESMEASGSGGNHGVSGITSGESTITLIQEGRDPLSMMGSLITGMGVLGKEEEQDHVLPDGKEEFVPPAEKDTERETAWSGSLPLEIEEPGNSLSESRKKTEGKSRMEISAENEGDPAGGFTENVSGKIVEHSLGDPAETKTENDSEMALSGEVNKILEGLEEMVSRLFVLAIRGIFLVHRIF